MPRPRAKGRVRAEGAAESGETDGGASAEAGDRQEEDMEVEATEDAATPNPLRNFNIEGKICCCWGGGGCDLDSNLLH